jgi:hypothetical protein
MLLGLVKPSLGQNNVRKFRQFAPNGRGEKAKCGKCLLIEIRSDPPAAAIDPRISFWQARLCISWASHSFSGIQGGGGTLQPEMDEPLPKPCPR